MMKLKLNGCNNVSIRILRSCFYEKNCFSIAMDLLWKMVVNEPGLNVKNGSGFTNVNKEQCNMR